MWESIIPKYQDSIFLDFFSFLEFNFLWLVCVIDLKNLFVEHNLLYFPCWYSRIWQVHIMTPKLTWKHFRTSLKVTLSYLNHIAFLFLPHKCAWLTNHGCCLSLSWRRSLSYRNQSIESLCKILYKSLLQNVQKCFQLKFWYHNMDLSNPTISTIKFVKSWKIKPIMYYK